MNASQARERKGEREAIADDNEATIQTVFIVGV